MTKLVLIISLLLCGFFRAQIQDSLKVQEESNSLYNGYLEKSIRQKRTAKILSYTSGGLIVSGIVVGNIISHNERKGLIDGLEEVIIGGGIVVVGVLTGLVSVPFWVASSKNAERAEKLKNKISFYPILQRNSFDQKKYAGIGFCVVF